MTQSDSQADAEGRFRNETAFLSLELLLEQLAKAQRKDEQTDAEHQVESRHSLAD